MLLLLLVTLALFALTVMSVRSLWQRRRVSEFPPPSQQGRRVVVTMVSVVCGALHLWSYWPLRPLVAADMGPGSVIYGGPGDGLWLMLVIAFPWFLMQIVNVGLACYCCRTARQAALVWGLLVAFWVAVGLAGSALSACPSGMTCAGG